MNTDIIIKDLDGKEAKLGQIILNRPKALNALTLDMCQQIHTALDRWESDPNFCAVMIKGNGGRAFCAGGDVRTLYDNQQAAKKTPNHFFWHEYRMNARLYHFKKPYISFLDGITMGGGAGVSLHGSHRIGTERLMLAMPETGIGFFPDIGASDFLLKCPGKIGYYLALTGSIIGVPDAKALGLITHVIPSAHLDKVEQALLDHPIHSHQDVNKILNQFVEQPALSELIEHQSFINSCFKQTSVENIMEALRIYPNEWTSNTYNMLQTRSPTSLKVTLEQFKRAEKLSFDDKIKMDFNIAQYFMQGHDFIEGIRAALVDKDNRPRWKPPTLKEVSQHDVEAYFVPCEKPLEL